MENREKAQFNPLVGQIAEKGMLRQELQGEMTPVQEFKDKPVDEEAEKAGLYDKLQKDIEKAKKKNDADRLWDLHNRSCNAGFYDLAEEAIDALPEDDVRRDGEGYRYYNGGYYALAHRYLFNQKDVSSAVRVLMKIQNIDNRDRAIKHYLEVLAEQEDRQQFYEFIHALAAVLPKETVDQLQGE